MDKIWIETLERISALEERMAHIENTAVLGETFPEQQHRFEKERIEGYKPDRVFKDGVEQSKPEPESESKQQETEKRQ